MIRKGNKIVEDIFKGDKVVQRVYLGNNVIFKRPLTYNLLLNSSWSNGKTSWGWDNSSASIDTTRVRDGNISVKMDATNKTGKVIDQRGSDNPNLYLPAGTVVTLSCWIYTEDKSAVGGRGVGLGLTMINSGGTVVSNPERFKLPSESNKWILYRETFTLAEGTQRINAKLIVNNGGIVWFNSPKLEIGVNSYPEWTPASSETENLLLNTNRVVTNNSYSIASYNLVEKPVVGETYTITIWGEVAPGGTFVPYNSGAMVSLVWLPKVSEGVYSKTFTWRNKNSSESSYTASDTYINVFVMNRGTNNSTINKIKLEKGKNPNPEWSANPNDVDTLSDS